jgi:DNA-binding beta-propeller fold protein YncE
VVSDPSTNSLWTISLPGDEIAPFALTVERPMHLAVAGDRLLVAELLADRVALLDAGGTVIRHFGGPWLDAPAAAAIRGDKVFVVGFYDHAVHVLTADGTHTRSLGRHGTGPGEFTYPTDVEIDADGALWVADAYAHRIVVLDKDGRHLRTLGEEGRAPGQFRVVLGLELADERLYVADFENRRVQVLTLDGEPIAQLGGDGDKDSTPADVLVHDGRVYIADQAGAAIDVWEDRP